MRYITIDTETTGLDHTKHELLELALVLEDTENLAHIPVEDLPFFVGYLRHEDAVWSNYCLKLHAGKPCMEAQDPGCVKIGDGLVYSHIAELEAEALQWLSSFCITPARQATPAGKNYGAFDRWFLPPVLRSAFNRRALDPGSLFVDWSRNDLLSLKELTGREPAHTALEDARDVIRVLRRAYTSAPLTETDKAWAKSIAART